MSVPVLVPYTAHLSASTIVRFIRRVSHRARPPAGRPNRLLPPLPLVLGVGQNRWDSIERYREVIPETTQRSPEGSRLVLEDEQDIEITVRVGIASCFGAVDHHMIDDARIPFGEGVTVDL
jgi:hypothetical protein